MVVKIDL